MHPIVGLDAGSPEEIYIVVNKHIIINIRIAAEKSDLNGGLYAFAFYLYICREVPLLRLRVIAVPNPIRSVDLHNRKIRIYVGIILQSVACNRIVIYIRDLKRIPDSRTIYRRV